MEINFRVNYYLNYLNKKIDLKFETNNYKEKIIYFDKEITDIGKNIYDEEKDICSDLYGFFLINKNFTKEKFKNIKLKKYKYFINKEENIEYLNKLLLNFDKTNNEDLIDKLIGKLLPCPEYDYMNYIEPFINMIKLNKDIENNNFLIRPGDVFFNIDVPVITKTRPVGINKNVLLNLDGERHWNEIHKIKKNNFDISFLEKDNKLIWRGASNGFLYSKDRPSRLTLVKKYFNHQNVMIDIGFSTSHYLELKQFVKNSINIENQLKSKFIISLEGGDVATNLKWLLFSNSVVLMPKPTMVSWLMEDLLEPWVHYIPLEKDFDDLEEKYNWCLNNLEKCEEISKNATKYIEEFLDEEKEREITNLVLKRYSDFVNIVKN